MSTGHTPQRPPGSSLRREPALIAVLVLVGLALFGAAYLLQVGLSVSVDTAAEVLRGLGFAVLTAGIVSAIDRYWIMDRMGAHVTETIRASLDERLAGLLPGLLEHGLVAIEDELDVGALVGAAGPGHEILYIDAQGPLLQERVSGLARAVRRGASLRAIIGPSVSSRLGPDQEHPLQRPQLAEQLEDAFGAPGSARSAGHEIEVRHAPLVGDAMVVLRAAGAPTIAAVAWGLHDKADTQLTWRWAHPGSDVAPRLNEHFEWLWTRLVADEAVAYGTSRTPTQARRLEFGGIKNAELVGQTYERLLAIPTASILSALDNAPVDPGVTILVAKLVGEPPVLGPTVRYNFYAGFVPPTREVTLHLHHEVSRPEDGADVETYRIVEGRGAYLRWADGASADGTVETPTLVPVRAGDLIAVAGEVAHQLICEFQGPRSSGLVFALCCPDDHLDNHRNRLPVSVAEPAEH